MEGLGSADLDWGINVQEFPQNSTVTDRVARFVAVVVVAFSFFLAGGCSNRLATSGGILKPLDVGAPRDAQSVEELPAEQAALACRQTGAQLEAAGHYQQAIKLYERSLLKDASQADLHHRLAVLYDQTGDAVRARSRYEVALQAGYRTADLLNDYGYFHLSHNRAEEAEAWLREAVETDPQHRKAKVNLAYALAILEQDQESLAIYSEVVGEAAAHSNLGAIMAQQGRIDQARRVLAKANQLDPDLGQPTAILAALEVE